MIGFMVMAVLASGLSPAAARTSVATPQGVRTEGSDADPVIIVDPRRGPVGTTIRVTARCGPPLRVIRETFRRPANFEFLGQPELLGSDPHLFIPESEVFQFRGEFQVPEALADAVTARPVPVVPGWYVVEARCLTGRPASDLLLRAFFCVPDCPPRSWGMLMNVHLDAATPRLGNVFALLTTALVALPAVTTTTTRPRTPPPQPSPPPPPTDPTTTSTTCVKKPCV